MKNIYLNFNKLVLLPIITILFTGCLKNQSDSVIITEPPTWDYATKWVEIQQLNTVDAWVDVANGKSFDMQWSYQDATKSVIVGRYQYNFTNLGLKIDTTGAVRIKNSQLSFFNINGNGQLADSAAVAYTQESDSTIILRNNSATPAIAIRYKKLKTL